MKPRITKLPYEDTPWMCTFEGDIAVIAGYGQSPEDAYEDMVNNFDHCVMYDFSTESIQKPIIQKTKDGEYWICSYGEIPGRFIIGYGKSPIEAWEDYLEGI